jgi:hypothetical protein
MLWDNFFFHDFFGPSAEIFDPPTMPLWHSNVHTEAIGKFREVHSSSIRWQPPGTWRGKVVLLFALCFLGTKFPGFAEQAREQEMP